MELIPKAKATVKVLHLQQKLFRWSENGTYRLKRFYNLLYNPFVLSLAWFLLSGNKGSRTAGVDGVTVKTVKEEIGVNEWLTAIAHKLRTRTFQPDFVRRVWIPKPFKPNKLRPLGIPTLEDRLIQMATKLVLEPIFEARFKGCSLGFRPNRGPLHAIATIRRYMIPRLGYDWVIEADFRSCFENINHHLLLRQIKMRVQDKRILSLIRAFLKAGVLEGNKYWYPVSGTPQGGIISPLLANIYLDQLDEMYHQRYHTLTSYQRSCLVKEGKPLLRLVRYADDFVILVKGTEEQAIEALDDLRTFVHDTLKMELAEEKTGIYPLMEGFNFLGYHFRRGKSLCTRKMATILLPSKEAVIRFRRKVKELTSRFTTWKPVEQVLRDLNRLIRGWGEYFRYGWVSRLFQKLDYYVYMRVYRWLRRKHKRRGWKWLRRKYLRPDITGRRRWCWKNTWLFLLAKLCRPIRLCPSSENVPTPFNRTSNRQTTLLSFHTGVALVKGMESVLRRLRTGGEPDDMKVSRPVRGAVEGNAQ